MHSSDNMEWGTPWDFYKKIDEEFGFTLDCCASYENHKNDNYFTIKDDAFTKDWNGVVWCNPPYGATAKKFVSYGYEQSVIMGHCTLVLLLAARTDTKMFHDYCIKGEIRFIRGRLKFIGAEAPAPFPSMLVIFRPMYPPDPQWAVMKPTP